MSISISISLSLLYLSTYLPTCLSIYLSIYLPTHGAYVTSGHQWTQAADPPHLGLKLLEFLLTHGPWPLLWTMVYKTSYRKTIGKI